ncbi:MAG: hypothetical protein JXM69_11440, partial [Anaerolineae bacterium]|nr:hypothetical protein [Anaerolineae bacterium]
MTKNLNLLKLTAILLFVVVLSIQTALPVTANGPIPFLEEFTGFIGSGFDPNPGVGQLDSDIWS